jgi:hypothetical protein
MINTVNMSVFLFAWEIFTSSGFSEITNQCVSAQQGTLIFYLQSSLCSVLQH